LLATERSSFQEAANTAYWPETKGLMLSSTAAKRCQTHLKTNNIYTSYIKRVVIHDYLVYKNAAELTVIEATSTQNP